MTTMISTAAARTRCQWSVNFAARTSGTVIESVSSLKRFRRRDISHHDSAMPLISPTTTQ